MYGTSSLRPASRARPERAPPSAPSGRAAAPSPGRRPCRRGPTGTRARSARPAPAPRGRPRRGRGPARRRRGCPRSGPAAAKASSTSASVTGGYSARPIDAEVGVLRPDARVVEPGRDRVGLLAPGRARPASGSCACRGRRRARRGRRRRRPPARRRRAGPRVSTNPEKIPTALEPPPTQATTTSGSPPVSARHCSRASSPIDAVELAHHPRVRVRAHHRAEAVVGVADGGHPVAHRLVDGVLQRAAAAVRRPRPRRRAGACGTR